MSRLPLTLRALVLVPLLAVGIDQMRVSFVCGPDVRSCLETAGNGRFGLAPMLILVVYTAAIAALVARVARRRRAPALLWIVATAGVYAVCGGQAILAELFGGGAMLGGGWLPLRGRRAAPRRPAARRPRRGRRRCARARAARDPRRPRADPPARPATPGRHRVHRRRHAAAGDPAAPSLHPPHAGSGASCAGVVRQTSTRQPKNPKEQDHVEVQARARARAASPGRACGGRRRRP